MTPAMPTPNTHLWGTHFVERHKHESLHKAAERYVPVQPEWCHHEQQSLGEESYYANREGEPRVLNEVEHVEVDREVVSGVSPSNVVQICLLDELTAIAAQKMRNSTAHIKTLMPLAINRSPNHTLITLSIANAKSHDLSKPIRCELCGTVGNFTTVNIDAPYRDPLKLTMHITMLWSIQMLEHWWK